MGMRISKCSSIISGSEMSLSSAMLSSGAFLSCSARACFAFRSTLRATSLGTLWSAMKRLRAENLADLSVEMISKCVIAVVMKLTNQICKVKVIAKQAVVKNLSVKVCRTTTCSPKNKPMAKWKDCMYRTPRPESCGSQSVSGMSPSIKRRSKYMQQPMRWQSVMRRINILVTEATTTKRSDRMCSERISMTCLAFLIRSRRRILSTRQLLKTPVARMPTNCSAQSVTTTNKSRCNWRMA
mmetsp:Transcript_43379/g.114258  ORF Transcript_43379/g.114258 Transcript_43379/m.114258 type:complete len:240 (+) Transcript_43379:568-1287(+)